MPWKNCGWMPNDTISTLIDNLKDPASIEIKEKIHTIADLNTNVLLYGETGVGKDIWARYLLEISRFPNLLNLNCGDVPENLLESEWFGYRKGAFTGAETDYDGKWKTAGDGILFLNQVDLLSLNLQARLLRIIERKKYFPLGTNHEVDVNARFIFSADSDIEEKVRQGEFRRDLFYRISSYSIFIPPLREREKDILPLLQFFAASRKLNIDLSPTALKTLSQYQWRGNIREMDNFVNNVAIKSKNLRDSDLDLLVKNSLSFLETYEKQEMTLEELDREYIYFLLRKYKSKVKVAKILDISRKSLYNRLKRYEQD